jgi:hypothetical protein
MRRTYRISKGPNFGEIVDSVRKLEQFARRNGIGHYNVDQVSSEPFQSGRTFRKWGKVIVAPNGAVIFDRDPRPDS